MADATVSAFASFANRYEKGTGGATREIARQLMSMSPTFTNNSKILDNATGTGIVIEEIQNHISSANPSNNIRIQVIAADAAQPMIDNLNAKLKHAQDNSAWPNLSPVTTHTVPAENLDSAVVPDDSITHAYMNFGIFFCKDPNLAASHIYRSLTPDGTALITSWHLVGYLDPIRKTHKTLYPNEPTITMPFSEQWEDPNYVKALLVKAGFDEGKVQVTQQDTSMRYATLKEAAAMFTEMFTTMLLGPKGWESPEARNAFEERLAENFKGSGNYSDDGTDGVRVRMVANIAACTK